MKSVHVLIIWTALLFITATCTSQTSNLSPDQKLGHDIFKELIEINTSHSTGSTTVAAKALAKRFKDAGFDEKDILITGPQSSVNQNIVIRLHGSGKKSPILFLAHLDVVEARREDWSMDPFKFIEQNGFFYGRGTMDIKDGAAILAANFIRLKREGFVPAGDLILALTAGEEGGADYNGVDWLLKNKRSLVDAAYCINMDAGDPQIKNGKRIIRTVQASEKSVLNLSLEVKNAGGHSSMPEKENAIYRLSKGLLKLADYDFPVMLNDVTKTYFGKMSSLETGQLAADMKSIAGNTTDTSVINNLSANPYYNAMMRTTCVATMLQGGHAKNALPQSAKAVVNCRVLPGTTQEEVKKTIVNVLSDNQVEVSITDSILYSPALPLKPDVMHTIEMVTEKYWPGIPVLPVMEVGGTDGIYLQNAAIASYGVSGVFIDVDDVRAHGKDERIGVKDFYDGLEYEYNLIKAFGSH